MSVIVKGMEMPDNCNDCWFSIDVCDVYCYVHKKPKKVNGDAMNRRMRPDWCPLHPLLEKHGRLIEADSLKETLDYYIREAGWDAKTNRVLGWVKDEFIDSEPTIVEAEGE